MNLARLKQLQSDGFYSLIAARPDLLYTSHERGIAPIMNMLKRDQSYFHDCIIVDKIIGKAAAMLLTLSHAQYIHGQLMSINAMRYLDEHGIAYSYDHACDIIINRTGTGMCPMEETVANVNDSQAAYRALCIKLDQLMKDKR